MDYLSYVFQGGKPRGADNEKLISGKESNIGNGNTQINRNCNNTSRQHRALRSVASVSSHTETAVCNVAPNARMNRFSSFRGLGQFKGSFGSSDGWGAKTICAFLPVPCFNNPVTAS